MRSIDDVASMLRERCPALGVQRIEALGEGDFCDAYLADDQWVVRVAKHRNAAKSLRREACLLPKIHDCVDLRVPIPEIVSPSPSPAFNAHRILPGPALTRVAYEALSDGERSRCATQVGRFLAQLHRVDTGIAIACDVPVLRFAKRRRKVLRYAARHAYPHLDAEARSFVETVLDPATDDDTPLRAVVLHGDLSPDHVLFDETTSTVTGIIDFGDLRVGDPAWDFVYLYEDYGLEFLTTALLAYEAAEPHRSFAERIYRWYLLAMIEWVAEAADDDTDELDEALGTLNAAQNEYGRRRQELARLLA